MTSKLFEAVNGHDHVLGATANARRSVVITKPRHFWPWLNRREPRKDSDRSGAWLRNAMFALGLLAAAAAVVSFAAQFRMVYAAKHVTAIAALEAGIPDAAALIFACLGIALALQGRRAVRARILNVGAVATSIAMNYLAAGHGWRDAAIWVMPPVAYALASDTAIGVVRAWAIARQTALDSALADDEATPLAILGGVLLWLLRLALAPPSTVKGFRQWVVDEVRVAPGRTAALPRTLPAAEPAEQDHALCQVPGTGLGGVCGKPLPCPEHRTRRGDPAGKQARLLSLAAERHDLPTLPLGKVSRIATALAPEADIHPSTARRVLLARVRELQDGSATS